MANILILGAGSMGTAFSFPCSDNNHSVTIVGSHLENEFIDLIKLEKKHPSLNCEIPKNVKFVKFYELEKKINEVNLIVVAVSSKGIEWASIELAKLLKKDVPILILTKGLAINNNSYEVLVNKMKRLFEKNGNKNVNISAAGGPCLAKGLANRVHTSVVYANSNIKIVQQISKLISTNYYHIFTSDDVVGVEVCAAIKNIFSMVIGASEGLCKTSASKELKEKNFLNTAAALLQQSLQEMIIFAENLKGKRETVLGLAGIGDLYVSADGGRNSKMGYYIGQGLSFDNAKKNKMKSDTVEGADLIFEIGSKIKNDFSIKKLPLMISMINTVIEKKPLNIPWEDFQ